MRQRAITALGGRDPILDGLIERHPIPPLRGAVPSAKRFAALTRGVISQQLAGNAAAAIYERFVAALNGVVTPGAFLASEPDRIRVCGLSASKAAAIRDLSEKVLVGSVSLERIGRRDDEAVIEHLTQVRGIGRWTAEMFLLNALGRGDVWPTGDYGVRAGFAAAWGLPELPSSRELAELGEPFRPYRSVLAWYCWRSADARVGPGKRT
jgi:3-methyladenine DNA glycosylase/8-oxoguanine DNA glycosylase